MLSLRQVLEYELFTAQNVIPTDTLDRELFLINVNALSDLTVKRLITDIRFCSNENVHIQDKRALIAGVLEEIYGNY